MGIIEGMAELAGRAGDPARVRRLRARLRVGGADLWRSSAGESAFRTLISVHAVAAQVRHRGAKGEVPGADGEGREARVLRTERARVGRRGDADDRDPPVRRHLRAQRPEELDLDADEADHALVFASMAEGGHRGISAFMVETDWEGVEARRIPNKLGILGPARPASCSSRTSRCRPRTASASRARASRSPCSSTRAGSPSRRAPSASSARASRRRSSTPTSGTPSARRSASTSSCRT